MRILFIQTGGTMDKDYPHSQQGWAFEIGAPAVIRILKKVRPQVHFQYDVMPLLKKDSLELTASDRRLIRETCQEVHTDRIILTHGTDTLLQTASVLTDIPSKVIVLVGAMQPERFTDSDADLQLGMAIGAAQTLAPGVYVSVQGLLAPWDKLKRDPQTGAFSLKGQ